MKKLITLVMILTSLQTFACINLTGTYQTAENKIYSNIQEDCIRMTTTDENGSMKLIFDNKEYLFYEMDNLKVYIKSRIEEDRFIYEERQVTKNNDASTSEDRHWSEVFFNQNRDLVTKLYLADGTVESYLDKRISTTLDKYN